MAVGDVNPRAIPRGNLDRDDARAEEIRQIFRTELGQNADPTAIEHFLGTGLQGNDLLRTIRFVGGRSNQLFDDAAFSAFARQMRRRQSQIEADTAMRRGEIDRSRQLARLALDRQRAAALNRVDDDFEARGMFRSGGRIQRRADAVRDSALRQAQLDQQTAEQQADVNRQASSQIADLSRQRDEQEIAARNRLTDRSIRDAQRDALAQRLGVQNGA